MPPEINPLKSLQVVETASSGVFKKQYYNKSKQSNDDWEMYSRKEFTKGKSPAQYSSATNSGKKWTPDEEEQLETLFHSGISIKEIAKTLSRGENGVRIKLTNLGLEE